MCVYVCVCIYIYVCVCVSHQGAITCVRLQGGTCVVSGGTDHMLHVYDFLRDHKISFGDRFRSPIYSVAIQEELSEQTGCVFVGQDGVWPVALDSLLLFVCFMLSATRDARVLPL